jgi:hypothetical protein
MCNAAERSFSIRTPLLPTFLLISFFSRQSSRVCDAIPFQLTSDDSTHRNPNIMASAGGPGTATVPQLKNLTIENITENVHRINSQCSDPRLKYVMERLVSHLHDFARETRLSFDEWMAGIQFLTQVGQICTDVRQVSLPSSLPLLTFTNIY